MPADTFTCGGVTATIERPMLRPLTVRRPLHQQSALDSSGNLYVTDRSRVASRIWEPVWPRVTAAELAGLITLIAAADGARSPFDWNNVYISSSAATVRFVSWRWQQTHPDWYRVEMTLEQIL